MKNKSDFGVDLYERWKGNDQSDLKIVNIASHVPV